eukprot:1153508-Pelagomonas_calceolata.AAC.3
MPAYLSQERTQQVPYLECCLLYIVVDAHPLVVALELGYRKNLLESSIPHWLEAKYCDGLLGITNAWSSFTLRPSGRTHGLLGTQGLAALPGVRTSLSHHSYSHYLKPSAMCTIIVSGVGMIATPQQATAYKAGPARLHSQKTERRSSSERCKQKCSKNTLYQLPKQKANAAELPERGA